MGLLGFLDHWRNPTRAWQEDAMLPLIVNLDEDRFCGVASGDPFEKLSFLGPAQRAGCEFAWPAKGVVVTMWDDCIGELEFYFGHAAAAKHGKFPGSFRYRGTSLPWSRESTESDVQSMIGPPYWRDEDDHGVLLFYEFPNREWQIEFDLDGTLKSLLIGDQLLADPEQRARFCVTKPWPPDDS